MTTRYLGLTRTDTNDRLFVVWQGDPGEAATTVRADTLSTIRHQLGLRRIHNRRPRHQLLDNIVVESEESLRYSAPEVWHHWRTVGLTPIATLVPPETPIFVTVPLEREDYVEWKQRAEGAHLPLNIYLGVVLSETLSIADEKEAPVDDKPHASLGPQIESLVSHLGRLQHKLHATQLTQAEAAFLMDELDRTVLIVKSRIRLPDFPASPPGGAIDLILK